ncbi:hypothetical protein M2164_005996 [Streptomyces sp. SAI-208]|uniref:DUF6415 family natural product biosynthesis protein n=1 Tax=Streptomyces sp. SAI-208 TaxID=2940550 RepID=UPI002473BC9A|nr:DUF6415 family natural product biosynthesis protein [Streptomyces sp. SAI-208]MDH6610361.1 hypothetical protein [Streptomyces sp. SAI-208]
MNHSTEHHAPAQHHEQLIAEAASATGILPTIERCEELRDQLRAAITGLAEQVRRRLDNPATSTAEWIRCDRALLQAQGALTGSLGSGLRSAALHVQTLGEAAQALAGCIREAE